MQLDPSMRYVLAISGGVDSMVLCDLACKTLPRENLVIAHFNHKIREDAAVDETFVSSVAARLGVRFFRGERTGEGVSEDSLRNERRDFLERVREFNKCEYILTAHHVEDQLETFLMRLLRGTGVEGLSSISSQSGRWVRPLLERTKDEIREYASREGVEFREDSTNSESTYFRNRVRQDLVPVIYRLAHGGKEAFLPKFAALVDELETARREKKKFARRWHQDNVLETPFWIVLEREAFLKLSKTRRERQLRYLVDRLGVKPLSREQTFETLFAIEDSKTHTAGYGILMTVSCERLFFSSKEQRHDYDHATIADVAELETSLPNAELRFPNPGDTFDGKKLKHLLLDRRVPQPERALLPVLAKRNSSELLWVFPDESPGVKVHQITFPFTFLDEETP